MKTHSQYPKKAGIYKIACNINDKIYIGKSVNIYNRIANHKSARDVGSLHNSIDKYGWENFTVEILEIFNDFEKTSDYNNKILEREMYYIKLYEATDRNKGYNICEFSADTTGIKLSESTREKMRNKTVTPEHREKMRQAMLGRKLSDDHRKKISEGRKGMKFSEEHKKNLSRECSEETRNKISLGNKGKKCSEETKKKMSDARKGKKLPESTIEKMRNKKLTPEHREKIRISWIERKRKKELQKTDETYKISNA
jgi:group I intron endonuclease